MGALSEMVVHVGMCRFGTKKSMHIVDIYSEEGKGEN